MPSTIPKLREQLSRCDHLIDEHTKLADELSHLPPGTTTRTMLEANRHSIEALRQTANSLRDKLLELERESRRS